MNSFQGYAITTYGDILYRFKQTPKHHFMQTASSNRRSILGDPAGIDWKDVSNPNSENPLA